MADDQTAVVHVEILGHEYPIRSGLDPDYVAELATYVDQKMQTAAARSPTGDTVGIAVLAALNIADEFFRCRDGDGDIKGTVKRRTLEIEEIVDRAIAGTDSTGPASTPPARPPANPAPGRGRHRRRR